MPRGVGLGFRPELAGDLIAGRLHADFLEVVAEGCFLPARLREARALGRRWPLVLHGVKQSLGSADGFDAARARRLARIAREVGVAAVSEHIAFTRAGAVDIGHLTTLPYTDEAVAVVAAHAKRLQAMLDVPLLLENVARTLDWPDDAMSEGVFLSRVIEASGCDLLLDVGNLYANARNAGIDPRAQLAALPLHRVRMLHVAGGVWENGFYYDTHAHPVPTEVCALVDQVRAIIGEVPVMLERDRALDDIAELSAELARLRGGASWVEAPSHPVETPTNPSLRPLPDSAGSAVSATPLAARQKCLAHLLSTHTSETAPFEAVAIARTRAVLLRKRVEEAWPFLPRLRGVSDQAAAVAMACLAERPRALRHASVADAVAIAEAACLLEGLRPRAVGDRLALRARFAVRDGAIRPRIEPYVGRTHERGGTTWAAKGFGTGAAVRMWRR